MVLAEAIGLDKDKPNRVTKVAVKMLKCKWWQERGVLVQCHNPGWGCDTGGPSLPPPTSAYPPF